MEDKDKIADTADKNKESVQFPSTREIDKLSFNKEIDECSILQIIAEGIQRKSSKPHFNFGTKLQTSVALIFRVAQQCQTQSQLMVKRLIEFRKKDENHYLNERLPHSRLRELFKGFENHLKFDLLMTQKPRNELTQLFSNQVRFPGGRCEGLREDDFIAIVRAVKEDSSFDLLDQNNHTIYLGYLPKNFFSGKVESRMSNNIPKELYTRAHIFISLDAQLTNSFKVSRHMEIIKWVPFTQILNLNIHSNFQKVVLKTPKQLLGVFPPMLKKFAEERVKEIVFVGIDVGMQNPMWGLHSVILVYIMSVFVKEAEFRAKKSTSLIKQTDELISKWNQIFEQFTNTYTTNEASALGNFLIKYYFKSWKDDFHKIYNQKDGIDYTFMMLIGVSGLLFTLDCYYKSIGAKPNPSL